MRPKLSSPKSKNRYSVIEQKLLGGRQRIKGQPARGDRGGNGEEATYLAFTAPTTLSYCLE